MQREGDDEAWRSIVENFGERAELDDEPDPGRAGRARRAGRADTGVRRGRGHLRPARATATAGPRARPRHRLGRCRRSAPPPARLPALQHRAALVGGLPHGGVVRGRVLLPRRPDAQGGPRPLGRRLPGLTGHLPPSAASQKFLGASRPPWHAPRCVADACERNGYGCAPAPGDARTLRMPTVQQLPRRDTSGCGAGDATVPGAVGLPCRARPAPCWRRRPHRPRGRGRHG